LDWWNNGIVKYWGDGVMGDGGIGNVKN